MSKKINKAQAKPIRISDENHARIKAIGDLTGRKLSINEILSLVLEPAEKAYGAEPIYAVKLYTDLAEARGEAIMDARRRGEIPQMPFIVVVVGADNGQ